MIDDTLVTKIKSIHLCDEAQMDVILCDDDRIMLEAPAGCGKTKTLVSKMAYLLSAGKLPRYKRILALTFSVNAAYKMKKDVSTSLPEMGVEGIKTPADVNRYMLITNYHGFSRRILKIYGYLLADELHQVDYMKPYNEKEMSQLLDEASFLKIIHFSNAIKECNEEYIVNNINEYNEIIIQKILPHNVITYNAYITLAVEIVHSFGCLKGFIAKLYPYIMIDEFQDTNILSWILVKEIITDQSKLFFMGDPLQRIYGFIGAIPNLLSIATNTYNMVSKKLSINYRFRDNNEMLLLEHNIRENAQNCLNPNIHQNANVKLKLFETQEDEAGYVSEKIREINDNGQRVALLIQARNRNFDVILKALDEKSIPYFYALFSDEDSEYIRFNQVAQYSFHEELSSSTSRRVNRTLLQRVLKRIKRVYPQSDCMIDSMMILTEAFFNKLLIEYKFLDNEEIIAFINDTFSNRALKQSMDYVKSNVFVTTVHGSKGLEWDNVWLPDMEQYVFPNTYSMCGNCDYRIGRRNTGDFCRIRVENHNTEEFLDELSVFYVACTRAKKNLIMSASKERYNAQGEKKKSYLSCLVSIPGISIG